MVKNKKGFLEFSFTWLFAIIVGAIILGGAIYAVTKLVKTSQVESDVTAGTEIEILLNPLETSFEDVKTTTITTPAETRIYNICEEPEPDVIFGKQKIRVTQMSFNKWTETQQEVGFENKYIFSENYSQGKNFYVFSKQFNFPYKTADLIYITPSTKKYCFVDAPEEIEDEIKQMKQANLVIENCSGKKNFTQVCFETTKNCNIEVNYDEKSVSKNGYKIYFETDALMYAGIFSSKEIYECQVSRLVSRTSELANIYAQKQNLISINGCESSILNDLVVFQSLLNSFESSENLASIKNVADEIDIQNEMGVCRLW